MDFWEAKAYRRYMSVDMDENEFVRRLHIAFEHEAELHPEMRESIFRGDQEELIKYVASEYVSDLAAIKEMEAAQKSVSAEEEARRMRGDMGFSEEERLDPAVTSSAKVDSTEQEQALSSHADTKKELSREEKQEFLKKRKENYRASFEKRQKEYQAGRAMEAKGQESYKQYPTDTGSSVQGDPYSADNHPKEADFTRFYQDGYANSEEYQQALQNPHSPEAIRKQADEDAHLEKVLERQEAIKAEQEKAIQEHLRKQEASASHQSANQGGHFDMERAREYERQQADSYSSPSEIDSNSPSQETSIPLSETTSPTFETTDFQSKETESRKYENYPDSGNGRNSFAAPHFDGPGDLQGSQNGGDTSEQHQAEMHRHQQEQHARHVEQAQQQSGSSGHMDTSNSGSPYGGSGDLQGNQNGGTIPAGGGSSPISNDKSSSVFYPGENGDLQGIQNGGGMSEQHQAEMHRHQQEQHARHVEQAQQQSGSNGVMSGGGDSSPPPKGCPVCGKNPCICDKKDKSEAFHHHQEQRMQHIEQQFGGGGSSGGGGSTPPPLSPPNQPCPVCGKNPCICDKKDKSEMFHHHQEQRMQHIEQQFGGGGSSGGGGGSTPPPPSPPNQPCSVCGKNPCVCKKNKNGVFTDQKRKNFRNDKGELVKERFHKLSENAQSTVRNVSYLSNRSGYTKLVNRTMIASQNFMGRSLRSGDDTADAMRAKDEVVTKGRIAYHCAAGVVTPFMIASLKGKMERELAKNAIRPSMRELKGNFKTIKSHCKGMDPYVLKDAKKTFKVEKGNLKGATEARFQRSLNSKKQIQKLKEDLNVSKLSKRNLKKELKGLKKEGKLKSKVFWRKNLSKEQLARLGELKSGLKLRKFEKRFGKLKGMHHFSSAYYSISGLMRNSAAYSDDAGISGFLQSSSFFGNYYTKKTIKKSYQFIKLTTRVATKVAAKTGGVVAKSYLNHTASGQFLKNYTTLRKAQMNILRTRISGFAHRQVQTAVNTKVGQAATSGLKTTKNVVSKLTKPFKAAYNGVASVGRVVTAPFRFVGKIVGNAVSFTRAVFMKLAFFAGAILLGMLLLMMLFEFIGTAFSVIMVEDEVDGKIDLSAYTKVLEEKSEAFSAKINSKANGTASNGTAYENVTYNLSLRDNTKEILSMMAVRMEQEFEHKHTSDEIDEGLCDNVKRPGGGIPICGGHKNEAYNYIKQLYDASHLMSYVESEPYNCWETDNCTHRVEKTRIQKEVFDLKGHPELWEDLSKYDEVYYDPKTNDPIRGVINHVITYYECPADHIDLTITSTVLGFDAIFNSDPDNALSDIDIVGNDLKEKVWNYLKARGLSDIQTAAIMGNIEAESGFEPSKIEAGNGIGYGLCQWSFGRRDQLEVYATARGKQPSDLGVQLDFLWMEIDPNASRLYCNWQFSESSYAAFMSSNSVAKATEIFMKSFERPNSNPDINHIYTVRIPAAKKYYDLYKGTSAPPSSEDTSEPVDENAFVWDEDNREWAKNIYAQDWKELYTGYKEIEFDYGNSGPALDLSDEVFRALITEGNKYLGTPYLMGRGNEPNTFDCSSFVTWVYHFSGVRPFPNPHAAPTAAGLYSMCLPISEADAKPGDLIFFSGTYKPGISHVGIYCGDGMMLHTGGNPDGVCYTSFKTSYWQKYNPEFGRLTK